MAEEKKVQEHKAPEHVSKANQDDQKISLNISDLQGLIAQLIEAGNSKTEVALGSLTEALRESRKPYKSEADLDNEAAFREQDRLVRERIMAQMKASQDACPHMQGSNPLSEFSGQLTSIVMHVFDTGVVLGICTNCSRVFRPEDEDYRIWLNKKSGNKISRSGQRFFVNQLAAQQAGR